MKTAYHTLTTWNESAMAAGFDSTGSGARQTVILRQPERRGRLGGDNVIDLTAWRAANLAMPEEEPLDDPDWAEELDGEPELIVPAPRPRKSRRAAFRAELISTASVAAVTLAIILRALAF